MISRTATIGASCRPSCPSGALVAEAVDDKGIDVTMHFNGEEMGIGARNNDFRGQGGDEAPAMTIQRR